MGWGAWGRRRGGNPSFGLEMEATSLQFWQRRIESQEFRSKSHLAVPLLQSRSSQGRGYQWVSLMVLLNNARSWPWDRSWHGRPCHALGYQSGAGRVRLLLSL